MTKPPDNPVDPVSLASPTGCPARPRFRFSASRRLHGANDFAHVFAGRARKDVGMLSFHGRPSALPHPRLGLSVSRRVGNAACRNRIKRRLREAFRLGQHNWPPGYDLVVVVRRHEPVSVTEYQRLMAVGFQALHQTWQRRERRAREGGA